MDNQHTGECRNKKRDSPHVPQQCSSDTQSDRILAFLFRLTALAQSGRDTAPFTCRVDAHSGAWTTDCIDV
jgi:hypothetical protein